MGQRHLTANYNRGGSAAAAATPSSVSLFRTNAGIDPTNDRWENVASSARTAGHGHATSTTNSPMPKRRHFNKPPTNKVTNTSTMQHMLLTLHNSISGNGNGNGNGMDMDIGNDSSITETETETETEFESSSSSSYYCDDYDDSYSELITLPRALLAGLERGCGHGTSAAAATNSGMMALSPGTASKVALKRRHSTSSGLDDYLLLHSTNTITNYDHNNNNDQYTCYSSHCSVTTSGSVSVLSSVLDANEMDDCLESVASSRSSVSSGCCSSLSSHSRSSASHSAVSFLSPGTDGEAYKQTITKRMGAGAKTTAKTKPSAATATAAPLTPVVVGGKKLNDLRAKLHVLRSDCHRKIAKSRASMTFDYIPSDDDDDDDGETLREEKKSNEQKPESEQSLTIEDVFGMSFSSDESSSSCSCSCSYSTTDEDEYEYEYEYEYEDKDDVDVDVDVDEQDDRGVNDADILPGERSENGPTSLHQRPNNGRAYPRDDDTNDVDDGDDRDHSQESTPDAKHRRSSSTSESSHCDSDCDVVNKNEKEENSQRAMTATATTQQQNKSSGQTNNLTSNAKLEASTSCGSGSNNDNNRHRPPHPNPYHPSNHPTNRNQKAPPPRSSTIGKMAEKFEKNISTSSPKFVGRLVGANEDENENKTAIEIKTNNPNASTTGSGNGTNCQEPSHSWVTGGTTVKVSDKKKEQFKSNNSKNCPEESNSCGRQEESSSSNNNKIPIAIVVSTDSSNRNKPKCSSSSSSVVGRTAKMFENNKKNSSPSSVYGGDSNSNNNKAGVVLASSPSQPPSRIGRMVKTFENKMVMNTVKFRRELFSKENNNECDSKKSNRSLVVVDNGATAPVAKPQSKRSIGSKDSNSNGNGKHRILKSWREKEEEPKATDYNTCGTSATMDSSRSIVTDDLNNNSYYIDTMEEEEEETSNNNNNNLQQQQLHQQQQQQHPKKKRRSKRLGGSILQRLSRYKSFRNPAMTLSPQSRARRFSLTSHNLKAGRDASHSGMEIYHEDL